MKGFIKWVLSPIAVTLLLIGGIAYGSIEYALFTSQYKLDNCRVPYTEFDSKWDFFFCDYYRIDLIDKED